MSTALSLAILVAVTGAVAPEDSAFAPADPTPMPAAVDLPAPGKVTGAWFGDNPYAADSSVHAYVIASDTRAAVRFQVRGAYNRPWLVTDHRRVVRVLDARGVSDHATVRVVAYAPEGEDAAERITDIEAYAHVYDGTHLTSTPVAEGDIFTTRLTADLVETTFSFAGVRAGAVLDLAYRTETGYVSQPDRAFLQEDIPVQAADYRFAMGPEFGYKATILGHHPVASATEEYSVDTKGNGAYGGSGRVKGTAFRFAVRDAPALHGEAYVTTVRNYLAQASVELERYARPSGGVAEFSTTWDDVADGLREREAVREALRGGKVKAYAAWAATCPLAADAPALERADWAVREVARKISWNRGFSTYSSDKIKRVLDAGRANVAGVNTALLGLMRAMGLDAEPLYLSTRDHGSLHEAAPDLKSLNALLVGLAVAEDDVRLYDATNPTTGQGVVDVRNLNGQGLLVGDDAHRFVPLQRRAVAQRGLMAELTLGDDGHLAGAFTLQLQDYAAFPYTDFDAAGALTIDPADLAESFAGYALADVSVEPASGYGYRLSGTLRSTAPVPDLGDALAVDPNLGTALARNPFAPETRTYPVEFPYRRVETRQVTIHLPPGAAVDELPAPASAVMPDRGVSYRSGLTAAADPADGHPVLTYSTLLAVKTLTYDQQSYPALRKLFDVVAEREGQLASIRLSAD